MEISLTIETRQGLLILEKEKIKSKNKEQNIEKVLSKGIYKQKSPWLKGKLIMKRKAVCYMKWKRYIMFDKKMMTKPN